MRWGAIVSFGVFVWIWEFFQDSVVGSLVFGASVLFGLRGFEE